MGAINFKELFPTKTSFIVFVLYILLFVNQGILVTASQGSNNEYNYNIVTVVLMTEVFKLVASISLYCREQSLSTLLRDVIKDKNVMALYFVPAFLYCLYNNLSFINLSTFDPTTYYLLLQWRVVVTAILFQVIFKKSLSNKQWLSLILLTFGCMLKQFNFTNQNVSEKQAIKKSGALELSVDAVFILIQVFCSCLAGVYNEYLLKKPGADVNIYVQNVFMYIDSIACNLAVLLITGNIEDTLSIRTLEQIFHYKVLVVMMNNAAVGIITSFFLKTMNSILKTYASALELVLTAILSYLFFQIPIYLNTALAIVVVLFAVYLYSQNPVSNVSPKEPEVDSSEKAELLMEEV